VPVEEIVRGIKSGVRKVSTSMHDETQQIARTFGAVCAPDFFGLDGELRLRYRGRLDASMKAAADSDAPRELFDAMVQIAQTGQGPAEQHPGMGCSIKWR